MLNNELVGNGDQGIDEPTCDFTGNSAILTGNTTYTFSNMQFGEEASDRLIVAAIGNKISAANTSRINTVTIGGVEAKIAASRTSDSGKPTESMIAFAKIPTGSNGNIVLTTASTSSLGASVAVYRLTRCRPYQTTRGSNVLAVANTILRNLPLLPPSTVVIAQATYTAPLAPNASFTAIGTDDSYTPIKTVNNSTIDSDAGENTYTSTAHFITTSSEEMTIDFTSNVNMSIGATMVSVPFPSSDSFTVGAIVEDYSSIAGPANSFTFTTIQTANIFKSSANADTRYSVAMVNAFRSASAPLTFSGCTIGGTPATLLGKYDSRTGSEANSGGIVSAVAFYGARTDSMNSQPTFVVNTNQDASRMDIVVTNIYGLNSETPYDFQSNGEINPSVTLHIPEGAIVFFSETFGTNATSADVWLNGNSYIDAFMALANLGTSGCQQYLVFRTREIGSSLVLNVNNFVSSTPTTANNQALGVLVMR